MINKKNMIKVLIPTIILAVFVLFARSAAIDYFSYDEYKEAKKITSGIQKKVKAITNLDTKMKPEYNRSLGEDLVKILIIEIDAKKLSKGFVKDAIEVQVLKTIAPLATFNPDIYEFVYVTKESSFTTNYVRRKYEKEKVAAFLQLVK